MCVCVKVDSTSFVKKCENVDPSSVVNKYVCVCVRRWNVNVQKVSGQEVCQS